MCILFSIHYVCIYFKSSQSASFLNISLCRILLFFICPHIKIGLNILFFAMKMLLFRSWYIFKSSSSCWCRYETVVGERGLKLSVYFQIDMILISALYMTRVYQAHSMQFLSLMGHIVFRLPLVEVRSKLTDPIGFRAAGREIERNGSSNSHYKCLAKFRRLLHTEIIHGGDFVMLNWQAIYLVNNGRREACCGRCGADKLFWCRAERSSALQLREWSSRIRKYFFSSTSVY